MTTSASHDCGEPTRLIAHFNGRSAEDQGLGWSELWDSGESDLWDRGKPSPALIDLVERRSDLVQSHTDDGRPKKALVPGCGRGYDVVMLALHGFDAYGLEISSSAVAAAEAFASAELRQPAAHNFGAEADVRESLGRVTFLQGDFFRKDWETNSLPNDRLKFDLIYDYTFLCALLPSMRAAWATRMADLLNPGGQVVCLEFPLYKDPTLPGPPWGLRGVHWNLLAQGGNGLAEDVMAIEDLDNAESQDAGQFTRALYIRPQRSYENGRGTDMLSVYVRR